MEQKADSLNSQTSRLTETATRRTSRTTAPDTLPRPETAMQVPLTAIQALPPGAAYTATGAEHGAPTVALTLRQDTVTVRARASPAILTTVVETSEASESSETLKSLRTTETLRTTEATEETAANEKETAPHTQPWWARLAALLAVCALAVMMLRREARR